MAIGPQRSSPFVKYSIMGGYGLATILLVLWGVSAGSVWPWIIWVVVTVGVALALWRVFTAREPVRTERPREDTIPSGSLTALRHAKRSSDDTLPPPPPVSQLSTTGEVPFLGAERPRVEPTRIAVVFDDGRRILLTHSHVLIGRDPTGGGESNIQLIAVEDPSRSLSKTHAELGVQDGYLWVGDWSSTNGTVIVEKDGTRRRVLPGRRELLHFSSRIELGQRWLMVELV